MDFRSTIAEAAKAKATAPGGAGLPTIKPIVSSLKRLKSVVDALEPASLCKVRSVARSVACETRLLELCRFRNVLTHFQPDALSAQTRCASGLDGRSCRTIRPPS